jgi:hypothetical protein
MHSLVMHCMACNGCLSGVGYCGLNLQEVMNVCVNKGGGCM